MYSNGYRSSAAPAGVAYTVVAWLVAQVLQLVFESFGTPDWVMKTVLVLPALGRKAEAKQRLAEFIEQNQSWAAFPISGYYASMAIKTVPSSGWRRRTNNIPACYPASC